MIRWDGRQRRVHRLVYEDISGPIPPGYDIHHTCNNRACVNPAHLQALSRRDHMLTMEGNPFASNARKTHCKEGHPLAGDNLKINANGSRVCRTCERKTQREWQRSRRGRVRRGTEHHHAVLTEQEVRAIRAEAASGAAQRTLAVKYGVGPMQISRIVNRKQWLHLP